MDEAGLLACTKCGESKPVEAFSPSKNTKCGYHAWCKACASRDQTERQKRNPEPHRLQSRKNKRKDRLIVLRHYSGEKPRCACCGEDTLEFLGIDHINGGGRKHRREINGYLYSALKRLGFPDGFRVLCHNCNLSLGAYGYCPHQAAEAACHSG